MKTVSIFGGTGFIGSELIDHLAKKRININVFTRKSSKAEKFNDLPRVKIIEINQSVDISELLKDSDIVINLVGILHETKSLKFSSVHKDWVNKIAKAAKKENISHFIHLGALQSTKYAPSRYLKSKYEAEEEIKKILKKQPWTILRPSIVFGKEDIFINLFRKMIAYLPIILVVSPNAKFQPIYVKDLVGIIIQSMNDNKSYGKIYNIAGPKAYKFIEIIKLIAKTDKKKVLIVPLNKFFSYIMVMLIELLPFKIITRDNLKSMELDNVTDINDAYLFKSHFLSLPSYLRK
ncbi:MAG: complex I NDUFA9 subunit family protein [Methylophilaceae bacterium]|nr:complex I NDUFA9 subunit family protein [Methylophilaceae bacterium]